MATAVNQGATGNPYIDGVLSGVKWSGTVTYSFPDSASDYPGMGSYGSDEPLNDFAQISAAQQTAVHAIMQQIVNYTNLTVTFNGFDSADIRLAESADANPTAYAYYPSNATSGTGGDVWFGNNYDYSNPVIGNYSFLTHIHEIGHAFGLKHGQETGGPGNVAIPADRDALEYTVMTYRSYLGGPTTGYTNEQWGYPQTFMMSDIAALQTMYGADYTYRSGNTVYSWTPGNGITSVDGSAWITPGGNRIFLTIWDGGGIDTYDFSAYSTGVTIDLGPGDYSIASQAQLAYLGNGNYAHGNVYNAYLFGVDPRSYIENAIGGSGDDFIYGNAVANDLKGGGGNDTINGYEGNDFLYGEAGNDTIGAGLGNDYVEGGSGLDTIYGEEGDDTIYGGTGDDFLAGNLGFDIIHGEDGNDTIQGGDQRDYLYGEANNDFIRGGKGHDFIYGGTGNDTILGNAGMDTIDGGAGIDVLTGDDAGGYADTFVFARGEADGDTITDFDGLGASASGDRLQFVGYGVGATFI